MFLWPQLELATGQDTEWPTLCPVGHSGSSCAARAKGQALRNSSTSFQQRLNRHRRNISAKYFGDQVNLKSAKCDINATSQWMQPALSVNRPEFLSGASLLAFPAEGIRVDLLTCWAEWCVLIKAHLNSFVLSKYSCKGKVQAHNLVGELLSINFSCWINTDKILERKKSCWSKC